MNALPIDAVMPEILQGLKHHRALVVIAEPGAGKSTRVAPALAVSGILERNNEKVVLLQPRRVAARAIAERIAEERGWALGDRVGYQVRFERRMGHDTQVRVLTEGILNRQLLDDPSLQGVGVVVLDEFHERHVETDLAIALLREVRETIRPDLKIIVMSATLDPARVSAFLGECPVVRAAGRVFPVSVEYRATNRGEEISGLARAVEDAYAEGDAGDTLVFLPGVEEIRRATDAVSRAAREHDLAVLPLHGSLTAAEQQTALRRMSRRKLILATNVAETSLTIDGVRTVVDTGLARIAGFDAARGMDRLDLSRISRASAEQRAGRSGRTAAGRCIRLWSEKEHAILKAYETPEIMRVDLAGTALMLHAWGNAGARAFGWYEAPAGEAIDAAELLLKRLGAMDAAGRITDIGHRMVALPAHPRLARLMIAAEKAGIASIGATSAAILAEKDFVTRSRGERGAIGSNRIRGRSDVLQRIELLAHAEKRGFHASLLDEGIDSWAARAVARARDAFLRMTGVGGAGADEDRVLRAVLAAYPDRVCRRRGANSGAVMVGGTGVKLADESIVSDAEFFLALDARRDERGGKESLVRLASAIDEKWLEEDFPQAIRRETEVTFDESRGRAAGVARVWYEDLILRESRDVAVSAEAAAEAMGNALREKAPEIFRADETANEWLARLELLRKTMPEQNWPAVNDQTLGELIADLAPRVRSQDQLHGEMLTDALRSLLAYPLDRIFDTEAPEFIVVPSGSRMRLKYAGAAAPILAVRLQEMFGLTETPRIAAGRVPVLLHLLAPNYRPVQVTDDLKSFWAKAYFDVRKDLRVRYPKHAWPENPLEAIAVKKGSSVRRPKK